MGQLMRDDLAKPAFRTRPAFGHFVDVHPDVGESISDWNGKAVDDLILIRQINPDRPIELDIQVLRQDPVRFLRNRRSVLLDAREMLRLHVTEVWSFRYSPCKLRLSSRD